MKKQTKSSRQTQLAFIVAAVLLFVGSFNIAAQEKKSIGEKYGSREPRTCADMKAPSRGAITAALAAKYFICAAERVDGQHLILVENVKTEVGASRPYNPNLDYNFLQIDVRFPLYPIRGSHTQYQCIMEDARYDEHAPGKNCTRIEHQKATGLCYKKTFGDWRCYQSEDFVSSDNYFYRVAPPKSDKAAPNPTAANNIAETKNESDADTDKNGFPKPDLSLLDEWYEISNVELDIYSRRLTFIAKAKRKEGRPTSFSVQFLDKDGMVIFEDTPLAFIAWFGNSETPTEPKRIICGTPGEGSMSAVKTIKIIRKPAY